jgi:hypothetical protein
MIIESAHDQVTSTIQKWISAGGLQAAVTTWLLETLPKAKSIFLVGSGIRAPFLASPPAPRDFDIIVDGLTKKQLAKFCTDSCGGGSNFFHGFTLRWTLQGQKVEIDLWSLAETYHIKEFGLPSTIRSFIHGAPFNLDKLAYELQTGTYYDEGCLAGIRDSCIRYAPARPYLQHVQAARCVLLKYKTKFALDSSARELLVPFAGGKMKDDQIDEVRKYLKRSGQSDLEELVFRWIFYPATME